MIWYEVVNHSFRVEPIEITRFSDTSVWVTQTITWPRKSTREKRIAIHSDWSSKFPTNALALAYAKERLEQNLHNARCGVADLEVKLAKVILFAEADSAIAKAEAVHPATEPASADKTQAEAKA